LEQVLKNIPEALKVLYILSRVGGSMEVKELHRAVERLARVNMCCKEYSFANYPWGPYSKDLEADIEILRVSGLVDLVNGGSSRRVVISGRGREIASKLEIYLDPGFRAAVGALAKGSRSNSSQSPR